MREISNSFTFSWDVSKLCMIICDFLNLSLCHCGVFIMWYFRIPDLTISYMWNQKMLSRVFTWRTEIVLAFWIVESRWATTIVVRPTMIWSSASCTIFSEWASRALVASSKRRIAGFFRMARAMAIRCFWPPESCTPRSPVLVSYPFCKELPKTYLHIFTFLLKE